jgi:hypothetical protein
VARRGRMGSVAETELLRVLVASDEYRARAAHEVRPDWFEEALHRELFDALTGEPGVPASDLAARLSPGAQGLWSTLRESGTALSDAVLDDHYASASEALEFRPLFREYQQLTDPAEKMKRKKALEAKYPRALRKAMHWQNPRPRSPQ